MQVNTSRFPHDLHLWKLNQMDCPECHRLQVEREYRQLVYPGVAVTIAIMGGAPEPFCGEKEILLRAFTASNSDYQRAVMILTQRRGVLSKKEYDEIRKFIDKTRVEMDRALKALDRHISKHGC